MAKFKLGPTSDLDANITVRVGSAATSGLLVDNDKGKFMKYVGDSQYNLCAVGDPIEGVLLSIEPATQDGWSIGTVNLGGESRVAAICDGLEATPGTGAIAVGDYVVCGTVVTAGAAMTPTTGPKVTKATNQPGATIISTVAGADTAAAVKVALDAALVKVADAEKNSLSPWRVVSLGNAGAVGDTCIIQKISC